MLTLLGGEAGSEVVADALRDGEPWMTLVNLGEVAYIVERRRGADEAAAHPPTSGPRNGPGGVHIRWLDVDDVLYAG